MRLSAPIFKLRRQAKLLARSQNIPLHEALDRVAIENGIARWSHLASSFSKHSPVDESGSPESGPAGRILAGLQAGDLLLLGARPGHGKTLLGLQLAALASKHERKGVFFTLEYTEDDVLDRLKALEIDHGSRAGLLIIDTGDDICASYIIDKLGRLQGDALVVIDYLQLLDQKRSNPDLASQIHQLRSHAKNKGAIIVVISQIDRTFELKGKSLPDLSDVRLPNPVDLTLFNKMCFLHGGNIYMADAA